MHPAWIGGIVIGAISVIALVVGIVYLIVNFRYMFPRRSPSHLKNGELWEAEDPSAKASNIRHICISLPYRKNKFDAVQKMFGKEGIEVERFTAVIGKQLNPDDFDDRMMAPSFRRHIKNNPKHLGHLGATMSHMSVWRKIVEENYEGPVAIIEDDCLIDKGFKFLLEDRMAKMNKIGSDDWDILYGGMSCSYDTYYKCALNDNLPVYHENICVVNHAIGLWYYVINGAKSAAALLKGMDAMEWMIDHNMSSEIIQKGHVKAYASVPVIAYHPGTFEISSFNEKFERSAAHYVSDTNK